LVVKNGSKIRFFIHADAGIGYGNFYVKAIFPAGRFMTIFFQNDIGGGQIEFTAAGHGLPGVDIEIKQDLLNLALIDVRQPEVRGEIAMYFNLIIPRSLLRVTSVC
jgi:hypothetical protein